MVSRTASFPPASDLRSARKKSFQTFTTASHEISERNGAWKTMAKTTHIDRSGASLGEASICDILGARRSQLIETSLNVLARCAQKQVFVVVLVRDARLYKKHCSAFRLASLAEGSIGHTPSLHRTLSQKHCSWSRRALPAIVSVSPSHVSVRSLM